MLANQYLKYLQSFIETCTWTHYPELFDEIESAIERSGTIYLLGSGTSGSTCDHLVNDLSKSFGSVLNDRFGLTVSIVSLTESMSSLTAYANDNQLENMFSDFLKNRAKNNDLLFVMSSSEPHFNVINAVKYCKEMGMNIVALTGEASGQLDSLCDVVLAIPIQNPNMVDDIHLFIAHCITSQLRETYKQPTVFLDRDGVINYNRIDHVKCIDEFVFVSDAIHSMRLLTEAGFAIVIITNQSCINKGLTDWGKVDEIHDYLYRTARKEGAIVSKIFVCPHKAEEECSCRKPKNRLIEDAISSLSIHREKSYLIGDHSTDITAGERSGLRTIFIKSGRGCLEGLQSSPTYLADNFHDAVQEILKYSVQPTLPAHPN